MSPFSNSFVVRTNRDAGTHDVSIDPRQLPFLTNYTFVDGKTRRDVSSEEERSGEVSARRKRSPSQVHGANTTSTSYDDGKFDNSSQLRLVSAQAQGTLTFLSLEHERTLLHVRALRDRLVVQIAHAPHDFRSANRFYVVLFARDDDVTASTSADVTSASASASQSSGTTGRLFFRQDHSQLDLFVFFSVFFASFFVLLAGIVVAWKLRQYLDARRNEDDREREMLTMASRPLASSKIVFEYRPLVTLHGAAAAAVGAHAVCEECVVLKMVTVESPPPAYSQREPQPHSSSSHDADDLSVQPLAFEATHDGAAGVATVAVQMPGGSQAACGLSLGSVLVTAASVDWQNWLADVPSGISLNTYAVSTTEV